MSRFGFVLATGLSCFVLASCGRESSIDTASATTQLRDYLLANWSVSPMFSGGLVLCGRWMTPMGLTLTDQRDAASGVIEARADVTFVINDNLDKIWGTGFPMPDNIRINYGDFCVGQIATVFGFPQDNPSSAPGTPSIPGLVPGRTLTAHGTIITFSKWNSGWKLTGFKFR